MPAKKEAGTCSCGCCGGRHKFWIGVLVGAALAVLVSNIMHCRCMGAMGAGKCAMMQAPQAEKAK
jgi:hypothetical protein